MNLMWWEEAWHAAPMHKAMHRACDRAAKHPLVGNRGQRELIGRGRRRAALEHFRSGIGRNGLRTLDDRRRLIEDDDVAGMKRAVNGAAVVRGIELPGHCANARD